MANPDKVYGGLPCAAYDPLEGSTCGRPARLVSVGLPSPKLPLCPDCQSLIVGLVVGGTR